MSAFYDGFSLMRIGELLLNNQNIRFMHILVVCLVPPPTPARAVNYAISVPEAHDHNWRVIPERLISITGANKTKEVSGILSFRRDLDVFSG